MSQLQDPPPWQGDPPAPAGSSSGTADSPRALLLGPAPLALGTRGLSSPSFSSRNIPELTCHPGAHPRSHGDCLPSALRNHLWLAAVGTQHSCPLPAAWPNKQRCFLLRLALPGWVSYPSTYCPPPRPPLLLPHPPGSPQLPEHHTRTLWPVWEPRGETVRTHLFLLLRSPPRGDLRSHRPRRRQTPGGWRRSSP